MIYHEWINDFIFFVHCSLVQVDMPGRLSPRSLSAYHLSCSLAFVLFIFVLFRGPRLVHGLLSCFPSAAWLVNGIQTVENKTLSEMVLWCSWLSHLSNTQKVSGSNPDRIMNAPVRFLLLFLLLCSLFFFFFSLV